MARIIMAEDFGHTLLVNTVLRYTAIQYSVKKRYGMLIDKDKQKIINSDLYEYHCNLPIPFSNKNESFSKIEALWNIKECRKCSNVCNQYKVYSTGNIEAKIFIIGEAPGIAKYMDQRPDDFLVWAAGPSTKKLKDALRHLKILHQCWFSNLLRCPLEDNRAGTYEEFDNCLDKLINEINTIKPKLLLLLGNKVKKYFDDAKDRIFDMIKIRKPLICHVMHPSFYVYKNIDYKEYSSHIKETIAHAKKEEP